MKKFLFITFILLTGLFVKAQIGIGFYPLGSMASLRWNPREIVRDSSKALFVTNYNYHLEFRSTLGISHNSRGTSISAQPEVAFFHYFAGKTGTPMLFSGAGALISLNHNGVSSGGVFVPLLVEYVPQLNFTHNLAFDLETDLLLTVNNSNHFSAKFRPMFSIAWIFSPPDAKLR
ncbi:MAG TPA: hypothetical protein VFJ43_05755 [Bacteroidia bacterium]|nr:hypothetical protein [Bacteroidia bacterium]